MNFKTANTIRKILLIIACISFIVGLVWSHQYMRKKAHNPEDIKITLLESESKYDDKYYYVYMDFKIENDTDATIDYLAITTYFTDKQGKEIGTMTSTYGGYHSSALNLKPSEKVIKETYLSEFKTKSSYSDLFTRLYLNGIEDITITYEITTVDWSDNYSYHR